MKFMSDKNFVQQVVILDNVIQKNSLESVYWVNYILKSLIMYNSMFHNIRSIKSAFLKDN